jgi:LysR family hca operon transcriptional activator
MRGKIDLALLRQEPNSPGLLFETLIAEPLIVLMAADHRLSACSTVRPRDLMKERLIGVPAAKSPVLRRVTDDYAKANGIELLPQYEVDNLSMAISLVVSTGGVALMPIYARNLLPPTVVSRPLHGEAPTIDLTLGYKSDNPAPKLAPIIARLKRMAPEAGGAG